MPHAAAEPPRRQRLSPAAQISRRAAAASRRRHLPALRRGRRHVRYAFAATTPILAATRRFTPPPAEADALR